MELISILKQCLETLPSILLQIWDTQKWQNFSSVTKPMSIVMVKMM